MTVKENMTPEQQQGTLRHLVKKVKQNAVTPSIISTLQSKANDQMSDASRIEAILSQIQSK
jgi:hypothetical protein